MGSVAFGLGKIGDAIAQARELQRQEQIEKIKLALEQGQLGVSQQYSDVNKRRFELEQAESQKPQFKGFTTVGNKIVGLVRDPDGTLRIQSFETSPTDAFYQATQKAINDIKDPALRQAAQDEAGMYLQAGDSKGAFSAVRSRVDKAEQEAATDKRAQQSRDAAAERQRLSQKFSREQQDRSFAEREKLSATVRNAGTNAVAVNSALQAISTIQKNSVVLTNLLKAGKIDLTIDPQGNMQSLVARGIKLSPQEAAVATAFAALTEHINLLRGPLGAQGFRGPEAFARLQAQRGNPLANPAVTLGVLNYTKKNLEGFQKVNERTLGPEAMQQLFAPDPSEAAPLDFQPEEPQ